MVSEAGRVGTDTGWTCSNFWICQIQKRFIFWWKHKEQLSRPPGEQKAKKTPPANPRRSLFENCFKSWFDTVRWWEMSCAFEIFQNYWFRWFLRRVMVILRQQKNFGPNVIYFVLRVDSWVSLPPGAKIREKQHLRIQEGHFLKSALNLDLTLSEYGKCPALLISCGIIDL